jgi:hypothetical protein
MEFGNEIQCIRLDHWVIIYINGEYIVPQV